ncbi:MAG: SDR family oxidoreductase [Deltaproteobacteria bacterium]|nr:SDR family oxidoreductase [Deltaproteobacteria bacterium]
MEYINSLFDIRDRVAIITGGGGIIGGELAKGFLHAGAKVIIIGRNEGNLQKKVHELSAPQNEISAFQCDVLDENRLKSVSDEILNRYGRIDILVNAAGGNMPGATIGADQDIFDLKMDELQKVTDLNFNGTVLPTLVFAKSMAENKKGSIINISSMASMRAITRVVGYSAGKAAVDNFTRWMAVELADKFGSGVRINAIAPGFLLTNQNRNLLTNEDGSLTDRGQTIINMTPFKRFGDPDEMVGAVIWLASDASGFVTGAIIPVDGGFSAFSGV